MLQGIRHLLDGLLSPQVWLYEGHRVGLIGQRTLSPRGGHGAWGWELSIRTTRTPTCHGAR